MLTPTVTVYVTVDLTGSLDLAADLDLLAAFLNAQRLDPIINVTTAGAELQDDTREPEADDGALVMP
jgi:hypothetical protein